MTDIGPGDLVECLKTVDERLYPHLAPLLCGAAICAGGIYTVYECVTATQDNACLSGLALTLVQPATHWRCDDGNLGGWNLSWFRPVRRPNADFIQRLQAPPPEAVRELLAVD